MVVSKKDVWAFLLFLVFFSVQFLSTSVQPVIVMFMIVVYMFLFSQKYGFVYIFLFLVLQKGFQRASSGFIYQFVTYWDEIIQLVFWGWGVLNYRKVLRGSKERILLLMLYFMYALMLIISTLYYRYSTAVTAILDLFVSSKFIIFLIGGWVLAEKGTIDRKKFVVGLNKPCKILSIVLFILTITDVFFFPLFEKFDYRFFTESVQLCFLHPTYLAAVCITGMAVLMLGMENDERNFRYIILYAIVTIFTFRTKAIASVFMIIIVYFIFVKYKLVGKSLLMSIAGCFVIYLSLDQIDVYFGKSELMTIRLKMMLDGIDIANNHSPLGAGLGTFGTTVAYDSGSMFYHKYKYMSGYYANQPVGDVFWPGIFAEAGWIGTVFFVLCVVVLLIMAYKRFNNDRFGAWSMMSIMIYSIIASTAETAFFNPATAFMFVIYGIAAADQKIMRAN